MTRHGLIATVVVLIQLTFFQPARSLADDPPATSRPEARDVLDSAIHHWLRLAQPKVDAPPRTFVARMKVVEAKGLPSEAQDATADIAYQAPDHLRITVHAGEIGIDACRDGNSIWIDEPAKKFAVLGKNGIAPFAAEPEKKDRTVLPPFSVPLSRWQIASLAMMFEAELGPDRQDQGVPSYVLELKPRAAAVDLLHLPPGQIELVVRQGDYLPTQVTYADGSRTQVKIDITDEKLIAPLPESDWALKPPGNVHVETVALSHLAKFLHIAPIMASEKAPALGPATGERELVASYGKGRLEMIDGTRVLFLKGSPEEMGHQQGKLLEPQIHAVAERILYGVGVGSSFDRGKWFIGEVESAEARLQPFMNPKYLREMDAMADACGMDRQEARLANFFPELFHCSGFSIFGKAVADGHMYHGRVLDYLRGVGLEQNAVVMVYQPDYGNAWVNVGYAGFIGTVTAMNEKGISIGEMGGKGQGEWDGKPMAHLLREVMEKANSLNEALAILKQGPRTCEYYYVVSDGKTHRAVGIHATPAIFQTVDPGQFNPLLPNPQPDTVMLSAGERYVTLSTRVKEEFGHFDADSARHLMDPPVCMKSNIQSVLFEPDTLDFWVANADGKNVASETRYTHYNLKSLLKSEPPKQEKTAWYRF